MQHLKLINACELNVINRIPQLGKAKHIRMIMLAHLQMLDDAEVILA
jgi:hypothetical protein